MFQFPLITISDRNRQTRERLPIADLQKSFKETWNKNDTWTITFSVIEQDMYAKAISLISTENIITYSGQEFIIKQSNREINNGTSTYTITASHRYYDDATNVRNNSAYNGTKTWSFQDAVNYFVNGNDQGVSVEFRGNFPTVQIENLGNCSFLKFTQDYFDSFNAVVIPNNKHWVLYSYDEFKKNNGKTVIYQHDLEDIKMNMDSTSIVNQCQCYGKPIDNTTPQKYSVDFLWSNQDSINRWGLHRGDAVSDERFTDQNSMNSYENQHQQSDPTITLELSSFNRDDYDKGEELLLIIPSMKWSTNVVLNHYERNSFLEFDTPTLQFDNTNLSLNDVNVALHDQIENINQSTIDLLTAQSGITNNDMQKSITLSNGNLTLNLNGNIVYASITIALLSVNSTITTVQSTFVPSENRTGTFFVQAGQMYLVSYLVDTSGNIKVQNISSLSGSSVDSISKENANLNASFNYLI